MNFDGCFWLVLLLVLFCCCHCCCYCRDLSEVYSGGIVLVGGHCFNRRKLMLSSKIFIRVVEFIINVIYAIPEVSGKKHTGQLLLFLFHEHTFYLFIFLSRELAYFQL